MHSFGHYRNYMNTSTDRLLRFHLPAAHVRGAIVHLQESWASIQSRADYAAEVRNLLGESLAASALFASILKTDGRLSIQIRGTQGLRTLFAECTAQGHLRGIARVADDLPSPKDLSDLGEGAILALTLESPPRANGEPHRYQGLVPIEAASLSGVFEDYFRQSEQLPTRLLLSADGDRCAGLLLQVMPGSNDADDWQRASALFETLGAEELLATDAETLLHRLFHEESPEVLAKQPLTFACSCSRARIEEVFQTLGVEEAMASVIDGQAEVVCEFCGKAYAFTSDELSQVFERPSATVPSPDSIQ
jgi:molecular chaperone Hsp33